MVCYILDLPIRKHIGVDEFEFLNLLPVGSLSKLKLIYLLDQISAKYGSSVIPKFPTKIEQSSFAYTGAKARNDIIFIIGIIFMYNLNIADCDIIVIQNSGATNLCIFQSLLLLINVILYNVISFSIFYLHIHRLY